MAEKKKAAGVQEKQVLAAAKNKPSGSKESLVEEISEDMDRFETWAIENGKYILGACIVVVIAIAVVFSVMHSIEKTKKQNAELLAKANTIEELEKALNATSSDIGRDMALMRLARLYIAKKDYASAIRKLESIVQGMKESYIAYRALLDIGYVNELAGKPEAALAAFVGVADAAGAPVDFRAEGAYGAGRLYYAKKDVTSAGKYFSRFDPARASSQQAKQWASLSRAALNRLPPASKPAAAPVPAMAPAPAAAPVPATTPAKAVPSKK